MAESEEGEIKLPTEEEIAKLPRWAQVAFAARCARRVQPLFQHNWVDVPRTMCDAIERAISLVEMTAAGHAKPIDLVDAFHEIEPVAKAASEAGYTIAAQAAKAASYATKSSRDRAKGNSHRAANHAAGAAAAAAKSLQQLKSTHGGPLPTSTFPEGSYPAGALPSSNHFIAAAYKATRRDYELLKEAAGREKWTDETPVPPEFFGPLWPDGVPKGWPVTEMERDTDAVELLIELEVPDDADDDEVTERLSELVAEMDGMHRAMGGGGLKVSGVDVEVEADQPVGVSS